MLALIDGDIVSYRCAASAEKEEEWVAIARASECIDNIVLSVGAIEIEVWLSDSRENNFRWQMYPEYKANRTQPPPIHLAAVKEFLTSKYGAMVATGEEADDALGYRQMESEESVICSIDKDLLQIPGFHFNFVKMEHQLVDYVSGMRHFYKQLLIGDTTDNIIGIYGIGKVKAGKMLDNVYDELEMFDIVRDIYQDDARLLLNGRLLWIRREKDELWEFPSWSQNTLQPATVEMLSSLPLCSTNDDVTLVPTSQEPNGCLPLGTRQDDGTMNPGIPVDLT
jgi:hypothetical protein